MHADMRSTTSYFSIVCLAFGVHLFQSSRGARPVGLVSVALAGTPIEYHMPSPALRACTELGPADLRTFQWYSNATRWMRAHVASADLPMLPWHNVVR